MKSPDAFRTISEVAESLDLPQHVLRFWETRFPQIRPLKRGGGRRYYRPEDVDLLKGIRLLLYGEGFTIKGVQRLLKEKGIGFVVAAGQTGSVQTVTAAHLERMIPTEPGFASASGGPGLDSSAFSDEDEGAHAEPNHSPYPSMMPANGMVVSADHRRQLESALALLAEAKQLLERER